MESLIAATAVEYVPAEHMEQSRAPIPVEYVPAVQLSEQVDAPYALEKWPFEQA